MKQFDVAVVGAGPGGYVTAIAASQKGFKTCLIEEEHLGGVCLNWGCIPTKALIHVASLLDAAGEFDRYGVKCDRSGFDYAKVQAYSRAVSERLTRGVGMLVKKNKIELVSGHAVLTGPQELSVGGDRIAAQKIVIATGSSPAVLKGLEFDGENVLSSTDILNMKRLPESLLIVGGGAIGVEFAYIMSVFGVRVHLIEMMETILPLEDSDASKILHESLARRGVEIMTKTGAGGYVAKGASLEVALQGPSGASSIKVEKILACTGRRPNSAGLGLDAAGVRLDAKGFIETGDYYRTNVPSIYAIGDVIGAPMLAHAASHEGIIAVEHMAGKGTHKRVDPDCVPRAVYCEPQIASFGLSEEAARSKGLEVEKGIFPFVGCGKAVAIGKSEGFVKMVRDRRTGEILGAVIVGEGATEMIHEPLLAKSSELLAEDVIGMVHAHPTLSESIMEAARAFAGEAIHI